MSENHLDFRSENGKRKILVVEDEAINRDLLELILQDDYDIIFAQTGEEALEHIQSNSFLNFSKRFIYSSHSHTQSMR